MHYYPARYLGVGYGSARVGIYLRSVRTRAKADLLWFLVFSYAAWGFKHVNVSFAGACILDCLLRRRFRLAGILATTLLSAFVITLAVGSEAYRYMLIKSQVNHGLYATIGISQPGKRFSQEHIGLDAISRQSCLGRKSFPWRQSRRARSLFEGVVPGCGGGVRFLRSPGGQGWGLGQLLPPPHDRRHARLGLCGSHEFYSFLALAVIVGSAVCIVGCLAVFSGKRGKLDCRDSHRQLLAIKACLASLPKPVLAWNNLASLPWINAGAENHFVLAAGYSFSPPEKYEAGGVEGLVASGYFASVLDSGNYHRELCERYLHRVDMPNCPGTVYLRANLPPPQRP